MISWKVRSTYLFVILITTFSFATSVFARNTGRYNIQFKQIDENIAFKGKRTEIVVSSTNGRSYTRIDTDRIYAWFDVIADENLVGFPRSGNEFLVNQRVPAAVWSGEENEPVGIRFSYTNPKQGRSATSPLAICNEQLHRTRGSTRDLFIREGREINLRHAYHVKITVRRIVASGPGTAFLPRKLKIITGTSLNVAIRCKAIDPTHVVNTRPVSIQQAGPRVQAAPITTRPGSMQQAGPRVQTAPINTTSGKAKRIVSKRKTPSGRPVAELIKAISLTAVPIILEPSGQCNRNDYLKLTGLIKTIGTFSGSTRFSIDGQRTKPAKFIKSRGGIFYVNSRAVINWDGNRPDANGIRRKAIRIRFSISDIDGVALNLTWKDVNVSCRA